MPPNIILLAAIGLLIALPLGFLLMRRRVQKIARTKKQGKLLEHAILGWRPSSRRIVLKRLPFRQGRAVWMEGEDTKWDVRAEPGFTQTLVIEETGEVVPCVCVDLDRKVVVRYEVIEPALLEAEDEEGAAQESPAEVPKNGASRAQRLEAAGVRA